MLKRNSWIWNTIAKVVKIALFIKIWGNILLFSKYLEEYHCFKKLEFKKLEFIEIKFYKKMRHGGIRLFEI